MGKLTISMVIFVVSSCLLPKQTEATRRVSEAGCGALAGCVCCCCCCCSCSCLLWEIKVQQHIVVGQVYMIPIITHVVRNAPLAELKISRR